MNTKQRRTLAAIFAKPTPAGIEWRSVASLIQALSGEIRYGDGSSVRIDLKGECINIHSPHPQKELKRYTVGRACQRIVDANRRHPMKTLTYKGYVATIEPDLDDGILVGRAMNTRDIIAFHGDTISESVKSFHAVIDEYLEDCRRRGVKPDRPYSGKFNLRLPPELHSQIASAAARSGKSLNQWVIEKLEQVA